MPKISPRQPADVGPLPEEKGPARANPARAASPSNFASAHPAPRTDVPIASSLRPTEISPQAARVNVEALALSLTFATDMILSNPNALSEPPDETRLASLISQIERTLPTVIGAIGRTIADSDPNAQSALVTLGAVIQTFIFVVETREARDGSADESRKRLIDVLRDLATRPRLYEGSALVWRELIGPQYRDFADNLREKGVLAGSYRLLQKVGIRSGDHLPDLALAREDQAAFYLLAGNPEHAESVLESLVDLRTEPSARETQLINACAVASPSPYRNHRDFIRMGEDVIAPAVLDELERLAEVISTLELERKVWSAIDAELADNYDASSPIRVAHSLTGDELAAKIERIGLPAQAAATTLMEDVRAGLLARSRIDENEAIALASLMRVEPSYSAEDRVLLRRMTADFFRLTGGRGILNLRNFESTGDPNPSTSRLGGILLHGTINLVDVWHELGHHVEMESDEIRDAAFSWVISRATDLALRPLAEIDPRGEYPAAFVGYRGTFYSSYVGRVYPAQNLTEVVSCGLQGFGHPEHMLALYLADREHFFLVLGMISS